MAARAISSGTISFGLVSIPVKLFTAASSEQARFNMLHEKCGGRLKQQFFCPVDQEVVDRKETVRGYEFAKGQYVRFTDQELEKLETERSSSIDIVEFVPLHDVDLAQVEKTYYLGPDKGGDKAYRLLSESMRRTEKVAVGSWAARGKEQLVLIRPYEDGLALHQLFYANEVRPFDEIDRGATFQFSDVERTLAETLITQLSVPDFSAEKYTDKYAERVLAAVEEKAKGQEITIAPEAPRAQIIDLFEALKKSVSEAQAKRSQEDVSPKPPKKASDRGSSAKEGVG